MKIQIYGAGMAGTFLYHLLRNDVEVRVFDKREIPDCRCAWGIEYTDAKRLYKEIGVNLDDYILLKPKYSVVNGVYLKIKNVVIFDKKRLLVDLWKDIEFDKIDADLYIDATGVARAFLPKIENDRVLPTFQTLERHEIEDNIYIYLTKTGYAWAFPLGDNKWHIGAGEFSLDNCMELVKKLRDKYGFEDKNSECKCVSAVRILQPSKCKPFVYRNTVGVGEAIGCVSGAGEGNVPALRSAKILYECIVNDKLDEYENRILKELEWIEIEQKFVDDYMKNKKISALRLLPKIISIESKRSVELSFTTFRKLIGL